MLCPYCMEVPSSDCTINGCPFSDFDDETYLSDPDFGDDPERGLCSVCCGTGDLEETMGRCPYCHDGYQLWSY